MIPAPRGHFTADVGGPADAPIVLLLHGFPQSRHSWREGHFATDQAPADVTRLLLEHLAVHRG